MDLGFSKSLERPHAEALAVRPTAALLLAAAAAWQAASPTALQAARLRRGGVEPADPIQQLALFLASPGRDRIGAAALGGSFHPGVAARLTVGQEA